MKSYEPFLSTKTKSIYLGFSNKVDWNACTRLPQEKRVERRIQAQERRGRTCLRASALRSNQFKNSQYVILFFYMLYFFLFQGFLSFAVTLQDDKLSGQWSHLHLSAIFLNRLFRFLRKDTYSLCNSSLISAHFTSSTVAMVQLSSQSFSKSEPLIIDRITHK